MWIIIRTMKSNIYRTIYIIWLLFITAISLIPIAPVAKELPKNSDKIAHFLIYFITAMLFYYGFKDIIYKPLFSSVIISLTIGIIIEFLQLLVPYRSFSLSDVVADFAGAITFYLIFWIKNFLKE